MTPGIKKYRWMRQVNILFYLAFIVIGIIMLYWSTLDELNDVCLSLSMLGAIFTSIGLVAGIHEYFAGVAYIQTDEWPLAELVKLNGGFIEFENGLVIDLNGFARLITYNYDKILKRGSVKIKIFFNRKGVMISHQILCE
jgi:hypothetical protein